jgi:hypothetical protein
MRHPAHRAMLGCAPPCETLSRIALTPFAVLFAGVVSAGCGCHADCIQPEGVKGVVFLPGSSDAGDAGEQ